jgi:hypothetical protein
MLLARRLLTAGFVKKPRQHYGVVYVFCLTSSQNSPDQETRFILFAFLRVPTKRMLYNSLRAVGRWKYPSPEFAAIWE